MFCHWSPTGTRGWSNLAVRSSRDKVSSSTGWPSNREGRWRLRASTWSGARRDGLVNPGEPLLNVVRSSKPKMLTGLSQKGTWPGRGALPFPLADHSAIGEEAGPEPSVGKDTERGKPIVFPNG